SGVRMSLSVAFFFFQAEDGIRDFHVTGVQTCALPISWRGRRRARKSPSIILRPASPPATARQRITNPRIGGRFFRFMTGWLNSKIGRASYRERVLIAGMCGSRECRVDGA